MERSYSLVYARGWQRLRVPGDRDGAQAGHGCWASSRRWRSPMARWYSMLLSSASRWGSMTENDSSTPLVYSLCGRKAILIPRRECLTQRGNASQRRQSASFPESALHSRSFANLSLGGMLLRRPFGESRSRGMKPSLRGMLPMRPCRGIPHGEGHGEGGESLSKHGNSGRKAGNTLRRWHSAPRKTGNALVKACVDPGRTVKEAFPLRCEGLLRALEVLLRMHAVPLRLLAAQLRPHSAPLRVPAAQLSPLAAQRAAHSAPPRGLAVLPRPQSVQLRPHAAQGVLKKGEPAKGGAGSPL